MSLKDTADIDKPREKIISRGASSLSLAELVAAIIGRGTFNCDAIQIGKVVGEVLSEKTYETSVDDLISINGVGEAKACQIVASLELARRFTPPNMRTARITEASEVIPFVYQYKFERQEHLMCLSLSGANEVLNVRNITKGTVNGTQIHPREIFSGAIEDRAASIILVHNHPSGNLLPSKQDVKITQDIRDAGKLLGIELLDHIIIGPNEGYESIKFKDK
ncbi:MAG: DNA repair protein RadC [Methanocorpusculum sp.]|nr:DNA repair protein RadC [Methanocorpusculum sp.]